ncbi:MAG: hypothetical protein HY092_03295 [Candidatus Kerfeldbacteria bacterium]|nr:hypothetical protein [Candidatus Kerfeldbacteria bacterium]
MPRTICSFQIGDRVRWSPAAEELPQLRLPQKYGVGPFQVLQVEDHDPDDAYYSSQMLGEPSTSGDEPIVCLGTNDGPQWFAQSLLTPA